MLYNAYEWKVGSIEWIRYIKLITFCDKGLEKRLKNEGCDDCKCPTSSNESCKCSCKKNLNCEKCLEAFFYGDEVQKNKRYECIPITYTYVLKYFNRYSSEIYRIFLQKKDMIEKLNNSLIFSLGCGPATELVSIDELIKVNHLQNVTYYGYEPNKFWDKTHSIASYNHDNKELNFEFKNELIKAETAGIDRIDFLFLNYVCSDVYVHENSNKETLMEWLENKVSPLIYKMKQGAYVIINDVNSPNMGRKEIQEWSWNLKQNEIVNAEYFTFEKLMPSKIYMGQPYELKFDLKVKSNTIRDKELVFQDSYSITGSKYCRFDTLPTECGSCFIILQVM